MAQSAFDLPPRRFLGRSRQFVRDWPLLAAGGLLLLLSLVFLMMPQLDLAASALFYDPTAGFHGPPAAVFFTVRKWGRMVEWALALALAAPLLIKFLAP